MLRPHTVLYQLLGTVRTAASRAVWTARAAGVMASVTSVAISVSTVFASNSVTREITLKNLFN